MAVKVIMMASRHPGYTALGEVGGRATFMTTLARSAPLSVIALRAVIKVAAELLVVTRDRGIRRPPMLYSVMLVSGLSVWKESKNVGNAVAD
jgi:hypothetical protein